MTSEELIWLCRVCDEEFKSYPDENETNRCPCGESFVDHNEHYFRIIGDVEGIKIE